MGRERDLKLPVGEFPFDCVAWDLVGDGNRIRRVG